MLSPAGHPHVSSYFSTMCSLKQKKKWNLQHCPLNEHSHSSMTWYIFPRRGPSHDISSKVKALVEEEVSVSLTPLLPQIPAEQSSGLSVKLLRYAAGCCCLVDRFSSLTSIRGGERGRGRGERSYVLSTPWMAWRTDGHRNAVRSASIVGGGGLP